VIARVDQIADPVADERLAVVVEIREQHLGQPIRAGQRVDHR